MIYDVAKKRSDLRVTFERPQIFFTHFINIMDKINTPARQRIFIKFNLLELYQWGAFFFFFFFYPTSAKNPSDNKRALNPT